MKQLVCEMCGSNDLIKDGGVFVCQSCGCKYSVEEARKMMIDGVVEVSGTVTVDNTAQIENFLAMAQHAREADNEQEAEMYCNKVIEIDPSNYRAWLIKGMAAGWQSTGKHDRMGEAIECFNKAVENAPDSALEDVKKQIADGISKLSLASIRLHCNAFKKLPSEDFANDIVHAANSAKLNVLKLLLKCGTAPTEFQSEAALIISRAATGAWNDVVLPEYKDEPHLSKHQFQRFVERGDACILLWLTAINMTDDDDDQDIQRYKNCIVVTQHIIPSYSVKYTQYGYQKEYELSPEVKAKLKNRIAGWKADIEKIKDKVLNTPELLDLKKRVQTATSTPDFKKYVSDKIAWLELKQASDAESCKIFSSANKKAAARKRANEAHKLVKAYENSDAWAELTQLDTEAAANGAKRFKILVKSNGQFGVVQALVQWFGMDRSRLSTIFTSNGTLIVDSLVSCYACAAILEKFGVTYSIV